MTEPLISCLMVTRNRAALAERAVECWVRQSWSEKELVIVDDGDEDYGPMLEAYRDKGTIRYERYDPDPNRRLGDARNISLDLAEGEFCMQWDDDEWYHPDRIRNQHTELVRRGLDALVLDATLMHLDDPFFIDSAYRSSLSKGIPGTILHRKTDVRYPNQPRAEDSVFLQDLRKSMKVGIAEGEHSHLFIRCFHGDNTWEKTHFTDRLRRTWADKLRYYKAKFVDGDIRKHPVFQLNADERAAVQDLLDMSRRLGVMAN